MSIPLITGVLSLNDVCLSVCPSAIFVHNRPVKASDSIHGGSLCLKEQLATIINTIK